VPWKIPWGKDGKVPGLHPAMAMEPAMGPSWNMDDDGNWIFLGE